MDADSVTADNSEAIGARRGAPARTKKDEHCNHRRADAAMSKPYSRERAGKLSATRGFQSGDTTRIDQLLRNFSRIISS
jgi:hypothetical protein